MTTAVVHRPNVVVRQNVRSAVCAPRPRAIVQRSDARVVSRRPGATRTVVTYRGMPGRDGIGVNPYTHTQSSASATWTVAHNLGYHPSVSIETPGGLEMIGEVLHQSNNLLTISFASARAGTARCL